MHVAGDGRQETGQAQEEKSKFLIATESVEILNDLFDFGHHFGAARASSPFAISLFAGDDE